MPKTTITVDTPIEDCGITCTHFEIENEKGMRLNAEGRPFFSTGYKCKNYDVCEDALYYAGVLKDADDEEEEEENE